MGATVGSPSSGWLDCLRALRNAWSICKGEGVTSEGCIRAGAVVYYECAGVVGTLVECIVTSDSFLEFVVCMLKENTPF